MHTRKIKTTFNLIVVIAWTAFTAFTATTASAQFGRLFGGPKIETIETDQLNKLLRDRQLAEEKAAQSAAQPPASDFVLVDVRSEKEVNVSVIPGAITKAEYEKNAAKHRGKLVIAYCTVGGRSGAYAKQLAGQGVKVKNYEGSILKWVDAELPLVTLDGQPTNRVHTYSDRYRVPAKYEPVR